MVLQPGSMESIGGFELVRRLGSGPRAEVFLGRSQPTTSPGGSQSAAVKLFRPTTPLAEISKEIGALERARSDHLVRLIDIASAPDGTPALILGLLGATRLSDVVIATRCLSAGEVVTATVPIVGAVMQLHRAGVSHGGIRLSNIVFDHRGAPVLVGFGRARLIAERDIRASTTAFPSTRADDIGFGADLADLAVVIRAVCAASDAHTGSVFDHLDQLRQATDPVEWTAELEDLLHDLGLGEPVRFDGPTTARPTITPPRDPAGVSVPAELGERRSALLETRAGRVPAWIAALGLPDAVIDVLQTPVVATIRRLSAALGAVRRPFWWAAGAVAVVLITSTVLIPQGAPSSARADPATHPSRITTHDAGDTSTAQPDRPDDTPDPVDTPDATDAGGSGGPRAEVMGDDPAVALDALLRVRSGCFDKRSVECLTTVDQAGSAAWDIDRSSITRQETGEDFQPLMMRATGITLSDRLGDSAILSATDVDSSLVLTVLVIRDEEGWRIRDIIAPLPRAHEASSLSSTRIPYTA